MKLSQTSQRQPRRRVFASLRANFLTGVVVIAPIGLTVWLIWSVVGWIDGFVLPFVPAAYDPQRLIRDWFGLDIDIRGIGVIVFFIFTIVVGWVAKGLLGRSLIGWAEGVVTSLPVVRTIYSGLKQIVETVLAQGQHSFEKACLVEYPRRGVWAIGFISTDARGEVTALTEQDLVSVFVPTTPNPTSGFLLFFPRREVKMLDMSIEDAAKLVISAGLVYPSTAEAALPGQTAPDTRAAE